MKYRIHFVVMRRFRHGKVNFHWCDRCGTILLGDKCDICSSSGRRFKVSRPGDIRPATGRTIDLIVSLFEKYFGTSDFLRDRLIFLNKVAGEDRTDEVIFQGHVIATIRYDLRIRDFKLDLRLDGARLLAPIANKGLAIMDRESGHLKGKNFSGDLFNEVKGSFETEDPLIILVGNFICSGVARVDSADLHHSKRAIGIRDVGRGEISIAKKSSWTTFVNANKTYILTLESKGISDIRSYIGNHDLPLTISFSGGKDSLACYGLLSKASQKFSMIFIDTGLEFPETIHYVKDFSRKERKKLLIAAAGQAFWDNLDDFGPPAKDFRWCCKVCKLAPLTNLIEKQFPKGTITVEGNRAFESFSRSTIRFVERNPFVPNQTILNPIKEWRAIDVWAYIWLRGLDYNPLYDEDFERIGCYLCPSCLESEWRNTSLIHPDLHNEWDNYLKQWAEECGSDDRFVTYGFWRWKIIPPKMRRMAEEFRMSMPHIRSDTLELKWVKGVSPCLAGGHSAEGVLSVPHNREFGRVVEALRTVGKVRYSEEYEIALVRAGESTLKVFGGGQIVATGPTSEKAHSIFEAGAKALLRAQLCTQCGICLRSCPTNALRLDNGLLVDEERCTSCGRCTEACVVAHYYDKLVN